jgi:branched-chain amino acid transport system substrate-binding protein
LHVGGDRWFFIVADYTFGHLIHQQAARVIEAAGGKVMGAATYPFPTTTDFSSFLIQAQSSGAHVVAFCNASGDLVNCVKQAHEFGPCRSGLKARRYGHLHHRYTHTRRPDCSGFTAE